MDKCIFCEIVAGNVPSYKIYEDEKYLAFLDIFPSAVAHTLVIPKKHVGWVWDHEKLGEYFEVVGKIAKHYRKVSGKEVVRSNIDGWQVPHAHIHLKVGKLNNLNPGKASAKELEETRTKYAL